MSFYGDNLPAGKDDANFAVVDENDTVYYMSMSLAEKIGKIDPNTLKVYYYLSKHSHILPDVTGEHRDCDYANFQYKRGADFMFTYYNDTVGVNENAHVINHVYYPNGTEISYDDNATDAYQIKDAVS